MAEWLERAKQRPSLMDAIAQFADESGQRTIVDLGGAVQEEMARAWRKVTEHL